MEFLKNLSQLKSFKILSVLGYIFALLLPCSLPIGDFITIDKRYVAVGVVLILIFIYILSLICFIILLIVVIKEYKKKDFSLIQVEKSLKTRLKEFIYYGGFIIYLIIIFGVLLLILNS